MKKLIVLACLSAGLFAVAPQNASAGHFSIGLALTFGWKCDKVSGHGLGGGAGCADGSCALPSYYSPIIGGAPSAPTSYPSTPAYEGPMPKANPEIKPAYYQAPAVQTVPYNPYAGYGYQTAPAWMYAAPSYWYGY